MKTFIEVHFKSDTGIPEEVFTVILNNDELATVVRTGGLNAANKALETFVTKFTGQFKERLSKFINR
jgi:hypothetical protein